MDFGGRYFSPGAKNGRKCIVMRKTLEQTYSIKSEETAYTVDSHKLFPTVTNF